MINMRKIKNLSKYFAMFIILVITFAIYFYNVFLKFQKDYSAMYAESIVSSASDFQNDFIRLSSAFFTNSEIIYYINGREYSDHYKITRQIKTIVNSSTIGNMVDDVLIFVPKAKVAFSTIEGQRLTYERFFDLYPDYINLAENCNVSWRKPGEKSSFVYNDGYGHITVFMLNKTELRNAFVKNKYPIINSTKLLNTENEIIMNSEMDNCNYPESVVNSEKSVLYKGGYMYIKAQSPQLKCINAIKITDVLLLTVKTGSFLILIGVCLFLLIMFIYLTHVRREKELLGSNLSLMKQNRNITANNTINMMFISKTVSQENKNQLIKYFSDNSVLCLLPMVIFMDNPESWTKLYGADDIELLKYGVKNIFHELLEEFGDIIISHIDNHTSGALLQIKTENIDEKKLYEKINRGIDIISENFKIKLFVFIGSSVSDFSEINKSISELSAAASFRFVSQSGIMRVSDFDKTEIEYPSEIQNKILQSVNMGNISGAEQLLHEFRLYLTDNGCVVAKRYFIKLYMGLYNELKPEGQSIGEEEFERLVSSKSASEAEECIKNTFMKRHTSPVVREESFEEIVDRLVSENFSNAEFCMKSVADVFEISAAYFGKKFKQKFGISFNSYLLSCRIKYAVFLLERTNKSNAEIALECGFNSESYFITNFKNCIGTTPKEYKKKISME